MLSSTSPRKALLACPFFLLWNLPSFTVEHTLSFSCFRSKPPFTRQGAALAHIDFLPLMMWYSGLTARFLFFGKGDSDILANCSLCGTEATLSFSAGSVCSSFSAEACVILHALCWSRQHQKFCLFSSPI